jgi:hypothetical protein
VIGNRNGAGQPPASFGYQPSGPKLDVARVGAARFGQVRGRPRSTSTLNIGNITFGLPSPSTLDYAHKLTTTSILLIGAVAFLLLGPRTLRGKLGAVARKHVGGS